MSLLERANDIIKNIGNVSDTPEGSGIHPNDFNIIVKEWLQDMEKTQLPITTLSNQITECPNCRGFTYNPELGKCEECGFTD